VNNLSIKCSQIIEYMDGIAPIELAEEWDNVGLIIGDNEKEVKNVLVCLDVTTDILNYAIEENADTIISHHPLIFKSIKRIVNKDWKSTLISRMIKNNINLYCAHTNLDYAKTGVNWSLANALKLNKIENVGEGKRIIYHNGDFTYEQEHTLAKVGTLETTQKLTSFVDTVKQALNIDNIRLIGKVDNIDNKYINKVMVFSGSFDDDILHYIGSKIDVIVTGDIKHHTAIEMIEKGIYAIDAGHFATENIIVPVISELLKKEFPDINIISKSMETGPFIFY